MTNFFDSIPFDTPCVKMFRQNNNFSLYKRNFCDFLVFEFIKTWPAKKKHVLRHFLTFFWKMQKIWHKKRHNSTSTYRIKLVDPSLYLYFIVLSFRISIFAFLQFFVDASTFFSLFTIDDVIVFHLTCQYRTFPLKWWPEILIWCYWYIIPTSDKVLSYLLYPINI